MEKLYIMAKKLIRLTEGDLHKIVKESVKRVLRESRESQEIHILTQACKNFNDSYRLCAAINEVLESLTNGRNPYTIKARRLLSTAVQDVNGDVNGIKTLVYQAIEELKNAIPWEIE